MLPYFFLKKKSFKNENYFFLKILICSVRINLNFMLEKFIKFTNNFINEAKFHQIVRKSQRKLSLRKFHRIQFYTLDRKR